MRLRTVQFACFVVLLSAFGVAAQRNRENCRDCAALHVLLAQIAAVSGKDAGPVLAATAKAAPGLPSADRTHALQPWTMRPPAAQSVDQHAVTASGL